MNFFVDETLTLPRPARRRRSAAVRLVERSLTVLIIGVGLITAVQYSHVAGIAPVLRSDTAPDETASMKPAYRFVEGQLVRR